MLLDGVDVAQLDHKWLHQHVAMVGQEPTLMHGTILENILYGLELDLDFNGLLQHATRAAQAAHADDFIRQLSEGYETQVALCSQPSQLC